MAHALKMSDQQIYDHLIGGGNITFKKFGKKRWRCRQTREITKNSKDYRRRITSMILNQFQKGNAVRTQVTSVDSLPVVYIGDDGEARCPQCKLWNRLYSSGEKSCNYCPQRFIAKY